MSPPLDLPWLLKSSLRVNVDWCMTATEGFHLSLMQQKNEENWSQALFCQTKICVSNKIWIFINVHAHPEKLVQQLACGFSPQIGFPDAPT